MSEWKEYKIEDVGKVVTGKTPRTAISDNYGGDIPFLTPSDDLNLKHTSITNKTLTSLGVSEVKNCLLPAYSVCVSCIGSDLGKVTINVNPTVTNQQINSVIVDTSKFDIDFVYYQMLIIGKKLNHISKTSTAVPIVNKSTFSQYHLAAPSLAEQKQISSILSSLDDKIETNRAINAHLEELSSSIFKSWFIDFEPFADGEFVEDEDGRRPKGWKIVSLEEIAEIVGGGTPSKEIAEYFTTPYNGISWLTPKDLSITHAKFTSHGENDLTELGYSKSSARLMPAGTILFSSRAPIGYMSIALNDICTNQGFKSAVPKSVSSEYLYYTLYYKKDEIETKATGSTFKEASGALMKSLPVLLPNEESMDTFTQIVRPIFEKQKLIENENSKLSSLRDTLLPRLMSGELIPV